MPTALVAQPDTKRMFMARRHDQRLVKKARYPVRGPSGEKVGETQGEAIQFVHGRFDCPPTGKVKLEDGRDADAAEVLAWLESHKMFGDVHEGFVAVDPSKPEPTAVELDRIAEAQVDGKLDTLRTMLEQERAGYDRAPLVDAIEKGIARVEAIDAKIAAAQEAEAGKKPAAKKPDPPAAA